MMSAPARSLESAGGDLSQRNRLVRVMTEETSIKKFAGLPSGLVGADSHLKSGDSHVLSEPPAPSWPVLLPTLSPQASLTPAEAFYSKAPFTIGNERAP
jgi:hypothetical protein